MNEQEVLRGGLPPACLGPAEGVAEWFRGYVQTYVERDVRQLSQITDLVAFRTLAQLAALRTAQVLLISTLARDAKLNAVTAGRDLDLLETSFLIRPLPPFLKNRSSRLVKSPKLHFIDSGLAAHLAGITSLEPGRDDLLRGALFETYVVQNLTALPEAQLAFWHEQGRHEVDFVIERGRSVLAIEVKAASLSLTEKEIRHVRENLTEEELTIFDLLTRPGPELTAAERNEVKKVAHLLLQRLKSVLTFNWRQTTQARARVRLAIEETLDAGLPRPYTPPIYNEKCSRVFEHIFETYTSGEGRGVYATAT